MEEWREQREDLMQQRRRLTGLATATANGYWQNGKYQMQKDGWWVALIGDGWWPLSVNSKELHGLVNMEILAQRCCWQRNFPVCPWLERSFLFI